MMKKVDWSYLLKWAIIILCPLLILCVPVNEMFTWPVKMFFVITLLAILLFALETIQQTAVAILLPIAYVVFQIAPSTVAFSPWTGNIPWMMIGGLILSNVLQNIGLLKRIAYKCIILTGCSYKGIIYGIGLAGLILNVMIPAQATIPLAALAFGICQAMGLKKSKAAAGIMLSAGLAALLPNYLFFESESIDCLWCRRNGDRALGCYLGRFSVSQCASNTFLCCDVLDYNQAVQAGNSSEWKRMVYG